MIGKHARTNSELKTASKGIHNASAKNRGSVETEQIRAASEEVVVVLVVVARSSCSSYVHSIVN
jgi:hypothetical protein